MATTKAAVPKRIGGVKLPKPLRRDLKKLAGSKSGRARIAEALVAAGGALAVVKARAPARKDAGAPKSAAKARAKPLAKAPAPKAKRPSRPGLAGSPSDASPAPDTIAPPAGDVAGT